MSWVREPTNKVIVSVQDMNGRTATTEYFVAQAEDDPASGAPAALGAAVQAISNGAVTQVELLSRAAQSAPGTPSTGPYDRVADKLKLEFSCADGSKLVLQLPGPKQTLLKADHYTVDPADSLIAALVTAMGSAKNAQGSAVVGLSNGYRRVPPRLRRRS